ncbi:hypothetical protein Rsub_10126 [Raphidocelis subcapitata]|uniref:Uncharacterized protein n=1 Tax=Raphidocelis subcapitata TaxID=307507 RepID=A0A2V0PJ97_9CHLO|nr:hypothetical protein Rsub_10126 [Raphidocelis subcapitata]|eukprot:GBF97115.1 hypothetical protein Rsub_10126 [Raphidocelis subcapitata]
MQLLASKPAPSTGAQTAQKRPPAAIMGRRTVAAALLGALGGIAARPALAEGHAGGMAISITRADRSVKEYMERRDEAARNKCAGGMFDCDGDRREFAQKQWKDFLDSGGVPKRVREGQGKGKGPRSF